MLLPSLNHLLSRASSTFKRFPVTILDSVVGTICFFLFLESEKGAGYNPEFTDLQKLGFTAMLGLPIFFAIELFLERHGDRLAHSGEHHEKRKRPSSRIGLYLIAFTLLGFFYMNFSESPMDALQLFVLLVAAHLVDSFVAYLRRDETNGFWQLNKVMFLRILVSVLYTVVLMIGLFLALGAVDVLFGVDVAPESYAQLAVILFGSFNTWFFLAGIPYSLGSQNHRTDYPKGLKIFTQFVLLPLVTIYLAILYPYAVKLLIESNLPKGWVSNPVLWFSVFGILSFLLLYPIRNESGNEWIRKFSKYFFIALLPLLALPALGIYTRVRDYGITEERYFVILLVIWLLGISLYFVISRKKDIRLIPISLAVIAVVGAVGPVSAFTISRISQLARLEYYLTKNDLLNKDRDVTMESAIPETDYKQINSIVNYFKWQKKERILEDWLRPRVPEGVKVTAINSENFSTLLNFKPRETTDVSFEEPVQRVSRAVIRPLTGFDYYVPFSMSSDRYSGAVDTSYSLNALTVVRSPVNHELLVAHGRDTLRLQYADIIRELKTRRDSILRAGLDENAFEPSVARAKGRMYLWIAFDQLTLPRHLDNEISESIPNKEYYRNRYEADGALFINIINPTR